MAIWDTFKKKVGCGATVRADRIAIVDAEVGLRDHKVHDIVARLFEMYQELTNNLK